MADKKRSHHKKKEPPKANAKKKLPRQDALPGMENAKIARIENLALDYAELRDERVALSAREIDLKTKLIDEMHKQEKTEYKRNGISIKLTVEKEGVKVRVKADGDEVATPAENVEVEESEAQPD